MLSSYLIYPRFDTEEASKLGIPMGTDKKSTMKLTLSSQKCRKRDIVARQNTFRH